jgi:hypothetical protein
MQNHNFTIFLPAGGCWLRDAQEVRLMLSGANCLIAFEKLGNFQAYVAQKLGMEDQNLFFKFLKWLHW